MKGIVFSIRHREQQYNRSVRTHRKLSFKRFINLYGLHLFFLLTFILGIVLGSIAFKNFDEQLLQKLGFLFLTNIENRLELSAFDIFSSSFASDFIFIFSAFLLSFTVWGAFALPLLCAFKGFGVGISSAYMFSQYSVTGIGFYILVILPGTVLFLFAFITALKEAFTQSVHLIKVFLPTQSESTLLRYTKVYLFRNFAVLILTAFSAIIDMLLWLLFANMFNF